MDSSANNLKYTSDSTEIGIHVHKTEERSLYSYDNLLYVQMLSGTKNIQLDGSRSINLKEGELLMTSNQVKADAYGVNATSNEPAVCLTLEIDNAEVKTILANVNERYELSTCPELQQKVEDFSLFKKSTSNEVLTTVDKLKQLHLNNVSFKDRLIGLAIEELLIKTLQSDMYQYLVENYLENVTKNPLSFAIDYINNNIQNRINIDSLADKANMSRATFYRQFKLAFGISPITYINMERIRLAIKLLKNTQKSISDICYELGYTSPSYFIKQFKTIKGISPSQFRSSQIK